LANNNATYTVTATDVNGCTATASTTVTVNTVPSAVTVSPASSNICSGGSQVLTAFALVQSERTVGTGTLVTDLSSTSSTASPNVFEHFYGGNKHQMLIRAADLAAQGITAGSIIHSLGFNVAAISRTDVLSNYQVKMGNTGLFSISTFQTGLTLVRNASVTTNVNPGKIGRAHV